MSCLCQLFVTDGDARHPIALAPPSSPRSPLDRRLASWYGNREERGLGQCDTKKKKSTGEQGGLWNVPNSIWLPKQTGCSVKFIGNTQLRQRHTQHKRGVGGGGVESRREATQARKKGDGEKESGIVPGSVTWSNELDARTARVTHIDILRYQTTQRNRKEKKNHVVCVCVSYMARWKEVVAIDWRVKQQPGINKSPTGKHFVLCTDDTKPARKHSRLGIFSRLKRTESATTSE